MDSDTGEVYVLRAGDDGWEQPTPVREIVFDLLETEAGLSTEALDAFSSYVDRDELAAVLDGNGEKQLSFSIEDQTVTVTANGEITIES